MSVIIQDEPPSAVSPGRDGRQYYNNLSTWCSSSSAMRLMNLLTGKENFGEQFALLLLSIPPAMAGGGGGILGLNSGGI